MMVVNPDFVPRHIEFHGPYQSASGKTEIWTVRVKDGAGLGMVRYHPGWRRYCFFPAADTLFEEQCLRDIAQFCENATATIRERWRRRRR